MSLLEVGTLQMSLFEVGTLQMSLHELLFWLGLVLGAILGSRDVKCVVVGCMLTTLPTTSTTSTSSGVHYVAFSFNPSVIGN